MTFVKPTQTTKRVRAERFEVAFNRIHLKLKEIGKAKNDNFMHLLNLARERHTTFRYNYESLKQFAKLRNVIVHEKVRENYYIADPAWDVVNEIERISAILMKPPYATSIASNPVKCFSSETTLKEVLQAIAEQGHSQFPIYDNKEFKGLLTEGGIAKWLAQHIVGDMIPIGETTAYDILQVEKPHNVGFLAKTSTIYDVEAIFEQYFDENKKIEAILITENGNASQTPIGIITSWDLVQIDHTTVSLVSN